eukprot:8254658-Pyramimonas_sp.AAC.1
MTSSEGLRGEASSKAVTIHLFPTLPPSLLCYGLLPPPGHAHPLVLVRPVECIPVLAGRYVDRSGRKSERNPEGPNNGGRPEVPMPWPAPQAPD